MKRNKILCVIIGMMICAVTFLSSCSSPKKEGKKLALKENRVCEEGLDKIDKLIEAFTVDFAPDNYSRREDAKNQWASMHSEIKSQTENELNSILQNRMLVLDDMDMSERRSFVEAYNDYVELSLRDKLTIAMQGSEYPEEVLRSISRINPVKPDLEQIKKDLAKRKLSDVEGGYYYEANKTLNIDEYNITDLKILNVLSETSNEYTLNVSFSLLGKNNRERRFDVQCNVRYVLPEYDDWTIDFIQTSAFTPVSSETYKSCVKMNLNGGLVGTDLSVKNECDKSLEVFVKYFKYGNWEKEVVIARAQENTFVTYGKPDEYKIEYILPL